MVIAAWVLIPESIGSVAGFLVLGSLSAMLFSAAKAGFGGAIGLLATPVMVYACGDNAKLAAAIMLPLLIVADQVALVSWWGKWNLRVVGLLLPGAVAGIAAGAAAFAWMRHLEQSGASDVANAGLMLIIGVISLAFVLIQGFRALRAGPPAFRPVLWQGTCFGAAAGFTSCLAHGAGPITAMYLLPQKLPKEQFVASTVLYYWINNLLKVPVYILLGRMAADAVTASVLLVPAVVAGTLLGLALHKRVNQRHFSVVVYVLLTLTGVHLIAQAVETFLP